MPRIIAVIPARGDSVRIPGKNLETIGGVPLVGIAIGHAIDAEVFDEIIVSTDHRGIAAYAGCYDFDGKHNVQILMRPHSLARGEPGSMQKTLAHAIKHFVGDVIVLLQPTSPLRSPEDIKKCVAILGTADVVCSVTECPADWTYKVGHAGRLRPEPNIVVPNGAVYVLTRALIESGAGWFSENSVTVAYVMPKERSLDIDVPLDLNMARFLASGKMVR